jgi:excisionase family DNA binding protein
MKRAPSTKRPALEVFSRPGGGLGEPGPSGAPTPAATARLKLLANLHQLVDALGALPSAEPSGNPPTSGRDLPLLLSAVEAGKLLSLSRTKVLAMASRGEIPSLRLGAAVRIPRDGLIAWIDERTKEPAWLRRQKLPAWARTDRSLER